MESWLIMATNSLTVNINNQLTKCYIKNILCLLIIFCKLNMLNELCKLQETGILLQNLAVSSSSVLETEVKVFQLTYGKWFLESIVKYINVIINFQPSLTEWIFAVPIVHYLMGQNSKLNSVEWDTDPSQFKYVYMFAVYL